MTWPNLLVSESNTNSLSIFIGFEQVKMIWEGMKKRVYLVIKK